MDLAAGRHGGRCSRWRSLSRLRARTAPSTGLLRRLQYANKVGGERAIPRHRARVLVQISGLASADQNLARRSAHDAAAERDHHTQEPDAQPAGAAIRRPCAGVRETADKAPSIERPYVLNRRISANGMVRPCSDSWPAAAPGRRQSPIFSTSSPPFGSPDGRRLAWMLGS